MIETLSSLGAIPRGIETIDGGTSAKPSASLVSAMGGRPLMSGIRVTPDSAMGTSVVNACVRVRSESIASLPLVTYRELAPRKKVRANDESLYRLLHDRPNPWQTSFEWREDMNRQFDTRGNAYSLIERNSRGEILNLYPLRSDRVVIRKGNDLQPYYECSEMSGKPVLSRERVFHLRGMTKDGYTGLSPIQELAEAVGLTIASEQFDAALFGSGALQSGFLAYKGSMQPEEYEAVKKWIGEQYNRGLQSAHKLAVIDGDYTWQGTSQTSEQAQVIETRMFQVEDLARAYRMPLPMIGHSDKTATYASAEQFFLAFVVHCLTPLAIRWEQALRRDLLTDNESDLQPTFIMAGLLRGDIKTRFAAYAVARQWGWFNVDEIRELEDMNELPDGKGQTYLEPMNMIEAGSDREAVNDSQASKFLAALQTLRTFIMTDTAPTLDTEAA